MEDEPSIGLSSAVKLRTFAELADELCPQYMSIGVPYNEYWYGDYTQLAYYRKAFELQRERVNYDAWCRALMYTMPGVLWFAYLTGICNAATKLRLTKNRMGLMKARRWRIGKTRKNSRGNASDSGHKCGCEVFRVRITMEQAIWK